MYSGIMKTSSIQITPELLAMISEIDEFKGAWRSLGTLAPERLKALRHVATIESIGSWGKPNIAVTGGNLTYWTWSDFCLGLFGRVCFNRRLAAFAENFSGAKFLPAHSRI